MAPPLARPAGAAKPPPLLMGIINVTPDSFSDGGLCATADAAIARGLALVAAGADILDVGGESTRPGHQPVPEAEELGRVLPVIEALAAQAGVPVSVDTMKAGVAARALRAGASIVNDVWGLLRDPAMAAVVAGASARVVVMHNRAQIDPALDIVADMFATFDRALERAEAAGVPRANVLIDPGIGFGKTHEQSLDALRALPRLAALGFPVLIGASRKRIIGGLTGRPVSERLAGTLGAHLWAAAAGAAVLRVHDVAAHRDALRVWRALG